MDRRVFLAMMGGAGTGLLSGCVMNESLSSVRDVKGRPNIIFILTDDQRYDAMSCMGHPYLKTPHMDRIRNEGVLYKNAFVTTSLCAPSRASFLTGAYAHSHGVIGNWGCEYKNDETPSYPYVMQQAGYETAFIGKWHMGRNANTRPGFDYWLSFRGQGVYTDPPLNENGRAFTAKGYMTDILTDYAVEFIKKDREKPYCLYLSHKAVHSPFTPAARHKDAYADEELIEPESARDTFEGKPKWMRGGVADPRAAYHPQDVPDRIEPKEWDSRHVRRTNYVKTINAVDDGVGRIFEVLEKRGELDNTVIMFAGDNGYFMGEHGRGDKRLMYEESIRIPLIMRYPPAVKAGSTVEQIVLNIDVGPTLLDLASVKAPNTMQGRSTVPLLVAGSSASRSFLGDGPEWRKSFLYEYWLDLTDRVPRMLGVRTEDWKLITYPDIDDIDEMYDLKKDPYEMTNLALAPEHAEKLMELSIELERLKKQTGYGSKPIPRQPRVSWAKEP